MKTLLPIIFFCQIQLLSGQVDTLDVLVFCRPSARASLPVVARTVSKAQAASEGKPTLICIEPEAEASVDPAWEKLLNCLPGLVRLKPWETWRAPDGGTGQGIGDGPCLLAAVGSEEKAYEQAKSLKAGCVLLAGPVAWARPVTAGDISLVYVPSNGTALLQLTLQARNKPMLSAVKLLRPEGLSDAVRRVLPPPVAVMPELQAEKAQPPLAPGVSIPLRVCTEQNGVAVMVTGLKITRTFGLDKSDEGFYVVLQGGIENRLPYQLVRDDLHPVAYRVDFLSDHVFLYVDGRHIVPLGAKENTGFGAKPQVMLAGKGDRRTGQFVFPIPAMPAHSLDFIFLDELRGHFLLPLWGERPVQPDFAFGPDKNNFLEFGVVQVTDEAPRETPQPDQHQKRICVTLGGRSVLRGKFQDIDCGFVVDFSPSSYLQLVEDDCFTYDPVSGTLPYTFQGRQKFLPGLFNHGMMSFRIPRDHGALKLCVFMPAKRKVENGTITEEKPEGMAIALGGEKKTTEAPAEPLRAITDGNLVRVTLYRPRETENRTELTVDVKNQAATSEIFRPFEQLLLQTQGGQLPADDIVTARLDRGATRYVRLFPGDRRRFSLVFQQTGYGIVYRGFTRAEITPLPGKTLPPVKKTDQAGGPAALAGASLEKVHRQTGPGEAPVARKALPPPQPVVKETAAPKGLAGVGLTDAQVKAAIEKGAAYLARLLLSEGTGHVGYDFVAAYAVLHSDRFREDPMLASRIIDLFRKQPAEGTYSAALRTMALRAMDPAAHRQLISDCATYLVSCQSTDGMWGYGPAQAAPPEISRAELVVIGGQPIEGHGADLDLVSEKVSVAYEEAWRHAGGDLSCTQYAALGLKAAQESGIEIPVDVWRNLAGVVVESQTDDGGWNYGFGGSTGYGSMTVAGFASYLIACYYAGMKPDPEVVERGYQWISRYFTVKENPGAGGWFFYYLYGLERAGVLGDVSFFGANEWYPQLAKKLVSEQQDDGSWFSPKRSDPVLDTAFALLCLSRSTVPLQVKPLKPQGGKGRLITGRKGAAQVIYLVFDASRSMRETFSGNTRLYWAKKTMADVVARLPQHSVVALRAFGARMRPNHPEANQDTILLVPPVAGSRAVLPKVLEMIQANGRTPLTLSLAETEKDLAKLPGSTQVTVVLLADGEESDPMARPFAVVGALSQRPNTQLMVIALATDEKATTFLSRLAKAGRGRFYHTTDLEKLNQAVERGIWRHTPCLIRDLLGKIIQKGFIGESFSLPEGRYEIEVAAGENVYARPFWINTEAKTMILFSLPENALPERR